MAIILALFENQSIFQALNPSLSYIKSFILVSLKTKNIFIRSLLLGLSKSESALSLRWLILAVPWNPLVVIYGDVWASTLEIDQPTVLGYFSKTNRNLHFQRVPLFWSPSTAMFPGQPLRWSRRGPVTGRHSCRDLSWGCCLSWASWITLTALSQSSNTENYWVSFFLCWVICQH